jgi:hypothetical protein
MSVIYLSDPVAPLKALAIHTAGNTAAYLSHTCGRYIQYFIPYNSKIKPRTLHTNNLFLICLCILLHVLKHQQIQALIKSISTNQK